VHGHTKTLFIPLNLNTTCVGYLVRGYTQTHTERKREREIRRYKDTLTQIHTHIAHICTHSHTHARTHSHACTHTHAHTPTHTISLSLSLSLSISLFHAHTHTYTNTPPRMTHTPSDECFESRAGRGGCTRRQVQLWTQREAAAHSHTHISSHHIRTH